MKIFQSQTVINYYFEGEGLIDIVLDILNVPNQMFF